MGWETREACPHEWGHGSLKGYATALRRRANELRIGFRGEHILGIRGGFDACRACSKARPQESGRGRRRVCATSAPRRVQTGGGRSPGSGGRVGQRGGAGGRGAGSGLGGSGGWGREG